MRSKIIYLLHPVSTYAPHVPEWIREFAEENPEADFWKDWRIIPISYDGQCGLVVNDIASRIIGERGCVVCLQPLQQKVQIRLRQRLRQHTVVLVDNCESFERLITLFREARTRDESGEPFLPRKYVAAVLILRKYVKEKYWGGGAKSKAYGYADEIAKGRGVDKSFQDIAKQVASDLKQHEFLISKPSRRRTKYALNPAKREQIMESLRTLEFPPSLQKLLMKDTNEVSARLLDTSFPERDRSMANVRPTFDAARDSGRL